MRLDEEIYLAKKEKEANSKVNELLEGMNFEDSSESGVLALKYSENAEFLREYPYFDVLRENLKNKTMSTDDVRELWETVEVSLNNLDSDDINTLKEHYVALASVYATLC